MSGIHRDRGLEKYSLSIRAANGGTLYHPRLITEISGTDEKFPVIGEMLELDPDNLRTIRDGLKKVTREGGTAYSSFKNLEALNVAGKTGTAQYGPKGEKSYAWFVCYAPVESPRIVLTVLVEEAETGGRTAAPIAARILKEYFSKPR